MNIIEKARDLGLALADSAEFTRMVSARAELEKNTALIALFFEFKQKEAQIVSLLQGDSVDKESAIALTDDIQRLKAQLLDDDTFSELLQSQKAFSDLLACVNEEINSCIGMTDTAIETESICSGDCSRCGGCAH